MRPSPSLISLPVTLLALAFGAIRDVSAQQFRWPEQPENLRVLPDSTRGARLGEVMRGFASALGVRCEHCHVGTGNDLAAFDFPADDKDTKRIARVMIEMVRRINDTELEKLSDFGRSAGKRVEVTCVTCHRSQARPRMIQDIFTETLSRAGADSAAAQYRELRERYYGGFSYDFRPGPLGTIAEQLSGKARFDEAIQVLTLSLEFTPDSYSTYYTLATVQERAGRKAEALASMEKALDLSPPNFMDFLRREVARLRGG